MSVGVRGACLGRAIAARSIALSFPQKLILAFALAIGVPLFGYALLMHAINGARMEMIDEEALNQRITILGQHINTTGLGLLSVASAAVPRGVQDDPAPSTEELGRMLTDLQAAHQLAAGIVIGLAGQPPVRLGGNPSLEARLGRSASALAALRGNASWSVLGHEDTLVIVAATPLPHSQGSGRPQAAVVIARALNATQLARVLGSEACKVSVRALSPVERAQYPEGVAPAQRPSGFQQVPLPSVHTRDAISRALMIDGATPDATATLLDVAMSRSALPGRGPRFVTVALCAFAFSLLLAALLTSLVTTWVSRPLEQLQGRVLALAEGNQSLPPLQVNTDDSLGRLARAFNRMVAERTTTQARALHNERLAMAGKMSAAVAHEVKNVLAPIHLRAEMLLQTVSDPLMRENLEGMRGEIDRSAALLRSLLDLSRQGDPEFRAVLIGATVKRAAQLAAPQATRSAVHLQIDDSAPGVLVWGDQAELLQIVVNLLNNAIEASARNIVVRTELVDDHVEVVVRDDGTGMDEKVRDRALEPFFTTKPSGKGTGLGLSICHSVVKAHRGTIGIESNRHGGTRITVCLPIIGED